jgi:hypothetical protein
MRRLSKEFIVRGRVSWKQCRNPERPVQDRASDLIQLRAGRPTNSMPPASAFYRRLPRPHVSLLPRPAFEVGYLQAVRSASKQAEHNIRGT